MEKTGINNVTCANKLWSFFYEKCKLCEQVILYFPREILFHLDFFSVFFICFFFSFEKHPVFFCRLTASIYTHLVDAFNHRVVQYFILLCEF